MCDILFSVVIPVYNKSENVKETIQSVLLQTEKNFEIIVIDDGSTDDSIEIIKSFEDQRIKIINQSNQGVSVARNNGIKNAKGKYVSFLDADDLWETNYLEVTKKLFEKYSEAKIACPSYRIKYEKKEYIPTWKNVSTYEDCIITNFLETAVSNFWIFTSSNITIKNEIFNDMNILFPVGESVYEDFDFYFRLGMRYKIAHSNKICATYNRITNNNARTSHFNKVVYCNSFMNTLDSFMKSTNLNNSDKLLIKEIKDRRMVPYIFSLIFLHKKNQAKKQLKSWFPVDKYKKYKLGLVIINYMPYFFVSLIQKIRYKIF
ncbi:MAG: glycosyltransferase family 2 protein [Thomasclavelia sp.]|nr:glycosyltransferase family 2 protein [Thomasclavelia sp.]